MSITSKENWLRFLRGEKPEWIPIYSETQQILPTCVPENIARGFITERQTLPESAYGGPDIFGVPWVYEALVGGSMEDPSVPPILENIEDWPEVISFPDIDSWDWEGARKRNEGFLEPDRLTTTVIFTGFFERLISFMGFEGAAMAMIDEDYEEELHGLFDRLADVNIDLIAHYKKYFDIDLVYFHDDWGAQLAPFFSLDTCRRMIVPHLRKVADYCHENGIFFDLHSCGHNDLLVPAMIDAHVDCWCGQTMCDKFALWEQYGDRIAIGYSFVGTSPEELQEQIDKLFSVISRDPVRRRMYIRDRALGKALPVQDVVERSKEIYTSV